MLKACLPMPVDKGILDRLRSTAAISADGFDGKRGNSQFPAWEAFSVALFHHRDGNPPGAVEWSEKCLAHPTLRVACRSSALSLQAMGRAAQGDVEGARSLLAQATDLNQPAESNPLDPTLFVGVRWYDWSVARIFNRESETMLEKAE